MKLEQILTEDVSIDSSIKNIVDVLSTELPILYQKLERMAINFYDNHGELGRGFRFISGGQKSQWYNTVYNKHLRPALYNLARFTNSSELKQYLSNSVGSGTFSGIEEILLPILKTISRDKRFIRLVDGVSAAEKAQREYFKKLEQLQASDDYDEPDEKEPAEPNSISQQNVAVDGIVSDVLNRLDRRVAGEIRNSIARADNKLQALRQELTRRGIRL